MSISSIGSTAGVSLYAGLTAGKTSSVDEPSAKDEFLKYQTMSPAQKMRAMMLAKLGLKEEDVKAMPPEKRKQVEDKLKDMIKQQVQNAPDRKGQTGLVANILA
ncbi:hypothetical protein [uncultured Caulobacter sp.]|jgi:hypothetical protein|uniref:hypothetical protein n=1 Tax=uncultured Caulobacter sp. TaxID=158749 RepID=UPI0026354733|nr:hypothetical protein [uncultured Caulobacter sp.]